MTTARAVSVDDRDGYRPIPGFEGRYSINDRGEIWSHQRRRHLAATVTGRGYLRVTLRRADQSAAWPLVHRLVLAAFVGPCPEGMEARHLNGDHHDNRLTNLQYWTASERHLTQVRATRRRPSAATAEERDFLCSQSLSDEEIAAQLGMQVESVLRAVARAQSAGRAA